MTILQVFERELAIGCPGLRGTRVTGTVPITQAVVNDILRASDGASRHVQVEIHPANRIVLHYSALHVEAVLDDALVVGEAPTLSVRLESAIVAWTLKRSLTIPGVQLDGRHITVNLGAVEALHPYRQLFPHIKAVTFATSEGLLNVRFELAIV